MLLQKLNSSLQYIKSKTSLSPQVGVILGSGLGHFVNQIDVDVEIPYEEIPGFIPPTVEGHGGKLVIGKIGSLVIAALQGRVHYYEGHSPQEVVHPTRVLGLWGIKTLIVTNAAGGLSKDLSPGSFVVLKDHINLTGYNPLCGPNENKLGTRFPDMSEPYNKVLSEKLLLLLKKKNIPHTKGVYCGVQGPCYETSAEVKYLGQIGGTCVGMSTVPEVIAANHMGLKVVGISCVTNLGTGLSDKPLHHDEVKEVAQRVETQFSDFLKDFIASLDT